MNISSFVANTLDIQDKMHSQISKKCKASNFHKSNINCNFFDCLIQSDAITTNKTCKFMGDKYVNTK